MRKRFEDLTKDELWSLRTEIVLNSLFVSDYENTFGYTASCMNTFFDGYVHYLEELAKELGEDNLPFDEIVSKYDNEDNLFAYYWCQEDWSWVEYEE